ncbi:5-methyltetrahydropteroyltriglutamate--homocysteine S-methyltransferase [Rossellomorea sp. DA94]|uniref:5-methyltetrahydropteroyltriglutamate-- homocysteine S-methyltransferase n=1 Tax=Rossellomorea sp. DA94 TaxID=3038653 RepID=UPI002446D93A|nr:5-methyltetrahydropteroyltriglutamate--homocysteine S-methyltransferase [Rossellomorea sp. DA94]WGG48067.1 5-methyltetrahydropteroyltriglutamate--homocysteine S-methyltransferase [Rossellomorea sp. DA94]
MSKVMSSSLGYPRIGENREWKKTLEEYWAGKVDEDSFLEQIENIRLDHVKKQLDQGVDLIPLGDFSLYDHVLDTAAMFGIVPDRFHYKGGKVSLDTYFEMARGAKGAAASEMTKWFNTNYHYIVPELGESVPQLVENRPLFYYKEAKEKLGIKGKPVIVGPFTFVKLSKGYYEVDYQSIVNDFVPLYAGILRELQEEGVEWVQIDEPILCASITKQEIDRFTEIYGRLKKAAPDVKIILQTYFDHLEHYKEVTAIPVDGIGMDFIYDRGENMAALKQNGFPKDKILAAGVVDGRNIWRTNLVEAHSFLSELTDYVPKDRLIIQPSSSLLHVPVTVRNEETLDKTLRNGISFADEKLQEVVLLTRALGEGIWRVQSDVDECLKSISDLHTSPNRNKPSVQDKLKGLNPLDVGRKSPFSIRMVAQSKLPLLPTTTIGSFPQTREVRRQRKKWRNGELDEGEYQRFIRAEIKRWIDIQEEIGLDVFVHGEFERTDMVEFFGEKLEGFHFTTFGWVQSYGSRCVKPPIIYGDVNFKEPMTVKETVYAQSLTDKPVKGMVTGPITILNWSFVRNDIPRYIVANQIALSLRKEIESLEDEGIWMIQVDEPALREGLPLKKERWEEYLQAAVFSFKLATSSVQNETQIHTHMCYSDFEDIIEAIRNLDADVLSIETSRSHGELINVFQENRYDKGIGLGVYDIHSPFIPDREEIISHIRRSLQVLDPKQFWINPDCGLKTRGIPETISSLKVMVEAAKHVRKELLVKRES